MKKLWFTSDTHFYHQNVIKYCNRPWKHADEMTEQLIQNWNNTVGDNDDIYHLGDIGLCSKQRMESVLCRLRGNKYLVRGNHDKSYKDVLLLKYFKWVKDYYMLKIQDENLPRGVHKIALFHYAMRVWDSQHYGAWQLYGHSHGSLKDNPNLLAIDVGVDCHGYKPISYEQIKTIMKGKNFKPVDGHKP